MGASRRRHDKRHYRTSQTLPIGRAHYLSKQRQLPNYMNQNDFALNETKHRFALEVDGHTAFIEYILSKENIMFLTHTEVPPALEGKGVGKRIVEKALQYIKDHNY